MKERKLMEGTMKAMVLEEPKKLVLKELPIPKIGPRDVLLKTKYAGICGSDFPIYKEGLFVPKLPQVIGHEASAVIVEKGELVEGFEVGDRVTGTNIQFCGHCPACLATPEGELAWGCENIASMGLGFGVQGVFAEYFVIHDVLPGISLFKIDDSVDDLEAAMCEPMCTGEGWWSVPDPQPGAKIVIIGAGIIGESILQQVIHVPDAEIVIVDYSDLRLNVAKEMGAHHIVNPSRDGDALDYVIKLWGNKEFLYNYGDRVSGNADIVYECSGNAKAWGQAVQIAKPGGKVATVGTCEGMAEISPQWIQLKQVQLLGGLYGGIGQSVADINAGKLRVRELATQVFPLEQLDEAFQVAMNAHKSIKVIIKVDKDAPDYPYNKQPY
ncbi:MAG: alcohol dehydrogenase catalytic domain-containing protein [Eubacterium sp.]|nr:alcohol dehydrogenase catalytic domain-containing protein [Eubacterium sp.]